MGVRDHIGCIVPNSYGVLGLALGGFTAAEAARRPAECSKFLPILSEIVKLRRKLNKTTLADLPLLRGVEMRRFLDGLIDKDASFSEISHHGLRTAWITRAALSEGKITETFAKRFVDHASTEIHEIYQRISATDLSSMFAHL
jgi:hypothetical protein